jgi:hypothetical protein
MATAKQNKTGKKTQVPTERQVKKAIKKMGVKTPPRNFVVRWNRIMTLDQLLSVLQHLPITFNFETSECPPQYKDIYEAGFLEEIKVKK